MGLFLIFSSLFSEFSALYSGAVLLIQIFTMLLFPAEVAAEGDAFSVVEHKLENAYTGRLAAQAADALGLSFPADAQILSCRDEHGMFGDGHTYLCIGGLDSWDGADFTTGGWNPMPLSEDAQIVFYGMERTVDGLLQEWRSCIPAGETVPPVENGYWLLDDRQSGQSGSIFAESRYSRNFTAALFDTDTGTLYYLKLDT